MARNLSVYMILWSKGRYKEERIERIAETVGYATGFVLSKAFTRIAGVSPQHYRLQATG